ncbi:MAG: deoxyribodipyrimidine photo-lyase [Colwellia sp.]
MLLWFRNDLRTHDNPALHFFLSEVSTQKLLASDTPRKAVFFISEKQWQKHHWSAIKIDLIKRHAYWLVAELAQFNIELEIVEVPDFSAQITYLSDYCARNNISHVIANSEVEINEQQRDKTCIELGIPLQLFEADVIVPKGKVLNKSGEMYKVFTPFKRAWLTYVKDHGFEYLGRTETGRAETENSVKPLHEAINENSTEATSTSHTLSSHWPLASVMENDVLPNFIQQKLDLYNDQRDIPSIKGTSGLSPYLAIGAISPRYLLFVVLNHYPDLLTASDSPKFSWVNELIWREFYRNLLFHFPELCKHECFKDKYSMTAWHNNLAYFKAWCEGRTGYPLVDAAMRQLNQTGWMHNRLRMVVASFLTKHLLIDWRWGEQYFMEHLIDGDLAANNGGWQWAASTGCDAQPYFRIFNPTRQSERFDPKGHFIRKYLPELKEIPDKEIHSPHRFIEKSNVDIYWPTIVEHKEARLMALDFYK